MNFLDPTGLKLVLDSEGDLDFTARFYLAASSDPSLQRNLEALIDSSETWIIRRSRRKGTNGTACPHISGIPNTGVIFWDPNSTMRFAGGGLGPPGLMLFHESEHAALHLASHPFGPGKDAEEPHVVSMERNWIDHFNAAGGWLGFGFSGRSSYGTGQVAGTAASWSFSF